VTLVLKVHDNDIVAASSDVVEIECYFEII